MIFWDYEFNNLYRQKEEKGAGLRGIFAKSGYRTGLALPETLHKVSRLNEMFPMWGEGTRVLVIMRKLTDSLAKDLTLQLWGQNWLWAWSHPQLGPLYEPARVYAVEGSYLNLCYQAKIFPIEPQATRTAFFVAFNSTLLSASSELRQG